MGDETSEVVGLVAPVPADRSGRRAGPLLRGLVGAFSNLREGRLTIEAPSGDVVECRGRAPGPEAILVLRRWRGARRMLMNGDLGFAESYIDGDWDSPDLPALINLAARNASEMNTAIAGIGVLRWASQLRHRWRMNTRRGSRRNIASHYDLGNEFYATWLDEGMTYSSAVFRDGVNSLEAAQTAKQDLAIAALELKGGERVLEIGCGWGGLAERLGARGCEVVALTLSQAQHDYATARLAAAGLSGRVEIRLQDYRDVPGTFDRIISVEMLEAVGREFWPVYFETIRQRLTPGGVAALQVITIDERRYESYANDVDFIQRYIFPGGMLPSKTVMREQIARAGLALRGVDCFGSCYAQTLAEWRRRFLRAWPRIDAMGFDTRFRRLWDYYLAYCEGGFAAEALDVGLYTIGAPA